MQFHERKTTVSRSSVSWIYPDRMIPEMSAGSCGYMPVNGSSVYKPQIHNKNSKIQSKKSKEKNIKEKKTDVHMQNRIMHKREKQVKRNLTVLLSVIFILSAAAAISMICLMYRSETTSPEQKQILVTETVQSGDTLWSIAEEHYTPKFGSVKKYVRTIQATNSMKDTLITPGMKIAVPVYTE